MPRAGQLADGAYLRPAVVTDLLENAPLATQEVFGPALAVWPLEERDAPVALANRTNYGLSARPSSRAT